MITGDHTTVVSEPDTTCCNHVSTIRLNSTARLVDLSWVFTMPSTLSIRGECEAWLAKFPLIVWNSVSFHFFFGHDFLATIVCDEGSPTSLTLPLAIWEMFFQHWGGRSLDVVNAGCESTRWLQHANFPSVPWKLRHQVWYKQIPKNPSLHLFFLSIQCLCIRFILILIREYKCHRPKSSGASCNTCIPSSSSPLRRDFLIKAFLSPLSCLYFGEGLSFCPL